MEGWEREAALGAGGGEEVAARRVVGRWELEVAYLSPYFLALPALLVRLGQPMVVDSPQGTQFQFSVEDSLEVVRSLAAQCQFADWGLCPMQALHLDDLSLGSGILHSQNCQAARLCVEVQTGGVYLGKCHCLRSDAV